LHRRPRGDTTEAIVNLKLHSRGTSTARHLADGFADGSLATLPMSAFMLLAQRMGAMGKQPPERITEAGIHAAGADDVPEPLEKTASVFLHFVFGGVAGAAFSAWARRPARRARAFVRRRNASREALNGMAFGTMVWAASYMGWVPALGIMPPAHRDRPGRPSSMILAHWIYGAALGWRTAARAA
jgi:hypothetical protein